MSYERYLKKMAILLAKDIVKATGGTLLLMDKKYSDDRTLNHTFQGVSIDSRTITEGEIFFALKGERFDGHDFLKDALLKGDGAVIDSKTHYVTEEKILIYVEDTLKALQDLAHFLRMKKNIPVIAITGSNGKTTTKEMTYAILSKCFTVLKNKGNLNNHIGLPLSLTRIAPDNEVIVLELGMNAPGEIKRLCEIAVPSHGVVTNIGSAHIGELGSLDAIRSTKFEILRGLGVAILNADDNFLMQGYESIKMKEGITCRLITFSINKDSHVRAENVVATDYGSSFTLRIKDGESRAVRLNVHGLFNVYNALAASAVGLSLGVHIEDIKNALENYTSFPMRFEVTTRDTITLINDAYNANPSSMEDALRELVRLGGTRRKVVVLGDMTELGKFAENNHRALGKLICDIGIDVFVAVGELMRVAAEETRKEGGHKPEMHAKPLVHIFKNADEVKKGISGIINEGDVVLIKGSRVIGMERIIERIRA